MNNFKYLWIVAVRKKNSISIGKIEPAQNPHQKTLKKHYNNNKYRHFKLSFESLQKHKQDSLNIKPQTSNHLSLSKAQKCNY